MERGIYTWALLCLVLPGIGAVQVTMDKAEYEFARGDNITLPCTFTPKPGTTPAVAVVTWSVEEIVIATYYYPNKVIDVKSKYEGRVSLDIDVPKGKAYMKLSSITLAENKNFECRLQIAGDDEGKPFATARVVVLVAPSVPICKIQGKAEYGQNINLTCVSEEGSPPPTYKWESRDVRNTLRAPAPRTTVKGGIMSLYNISRETSGFYICSSTNKIRSATCNVTLSVMPPSMNIGSTAGIIAGVAIFLIILGIIIYCCCCRKKNKEEEYAMGVREGEYHDKEPDINGDGHRPDRQESTRSYDDSEVRSSGDRRDQYEERSERGYDDRRDYDDGRSDYDDRRSDYNDRRNDYDDHRRDDDRRERHSDRNERYDDRRYDDDRHYVDDRRYDDDHRYDDERYDDRRDRRHDERYEDRDRDRPPVPANKPTRSDYDD